MLGSLWSSAATSAAGRPPTSTTATSVWPNCRSSRSPRRVTARAAASPGAPGRRTTTTSPGSLSGAGGSFLGGPATCTLGDDGDGTSANAGAAAKGRRAPAVAVTRAPPVNRATPRLRDRARAIGGERRPGRSSRSSAIRRRPSAQRHMSGPGCHSQWHGQRGTRYKSSSIRGTPRRHRRTGAEVPEGGARRLRAPSGLLTRALPSVARRRTSSRAGRCSPVDPSTGPRCCHRVPTGPDREDRGGRGEIVRKTMAAAATALGLAFLSASPALAKPTPTSGLHFGGPSRERARTWCARPGCVPATRSRCGSHDRVDHRAATALRSRPRSRRDQGPSQRLPTAPERSIVCS